MCVFGVNPLYLWCLVLFISECVIFILCAYGVNSLCVLLGVNSLCVCSVWC